MYKGFEKRIKRFLREQPETAASKVIKTIEHKCPNLKTYHDKFDRFYYSIGVQFGGDQTFIANSDKVFYTPYITFLHDNVLNEKARTENLCDSISNLSFDQCYEILAKELVYLLTKQVDLEKILAIT